MHLMTCINYGSESKKQRTLNHFCLGRLIQSMISQSSMVRNSWSNLFPFGIENGWKINSHPLIQFWYHDAPSKQTSSLTWKHHCSLFCALKSLLHNTMVLDLLWPVNSSLGPCRPLLLCQLSKIFSIPPPSPTFTSNFLDPLTITLVLHHCL